MHTAKVQARIRGSWFSLLESCFMFTQFLQSALLKAFVTTYLVLMIEDCIIKLMWAVERKLVTKVQNN